MSHRPEDLDPTTVRIHADPYMHERYAAARNVMTDKARKENSYVTLSHESGDDGTEGFRIRSVSKKVFESSANQCPQAADLQYAEDEGEARLLPSALATPDGKFVVAKPSLCEGCAHRLNRAVLGHCTGLGFKPLLP